MIAAAQLPSLAGATLKTRDADKAGKVVDAYASEDGSHGTFVTVSIGRVGKTTSAVPIHEATLEGDTLVVPYDKALIKDAPVLTGEDVISPSDEDRLYAHYGSTGDVLGR